jgi:hypothetical protein
MRDIVSYELKHLSVKQEEHQELASVHETLEKIAHPQNISSPQEREQFNTIKQQLVEEKGKGDPLASSILDAAKVTTKQEETTAPAGAPPAYFPVTNQVQVVSLDDYEAVKELWQENYKNIDVPSDALTPNRQDWIEEDMKKVSQTITLLTSVDPKQLAEGMKTVSSILPFLLIGGFSQTEVIAYLKAKEEAAKSVLKDMKEKEAEEETLIDVKKAQVQQEKQAEASEEASVPLDSPEKKANN